VNALATFSPATRAWFEASFRAPTEAQERGWPVIAAGTHTLIHAPTGSGKTLAAFLWTLDQLLHRPTPNKLERCRVLYVSPMKALAYDVDRNLRSPLMGIRHAAARLELGELPEIDTFLRTGDTPADERRRMLRNPPDILITTPESLYLMLTSQARDVLATVEWLIVDEVHAVAGSKRGAHLALSLERLERIANRPPQRIGLSATQRPLETIARFLGGGIPESEGSWTPRPVEIVDVPGDKEIEVELVVTVDDMTAPPPPPIPVSMDLPNGIIDGPGKQSPARSGIWPSIYPGLLELIERHRSTIVFANSRRLAERICAEINLLAGKEVARAHHGSVSRDQRVAIEEQLKRGELPAVVATSSLELGIDMGAVDLVVQVESPSTVANGLQRVGRAGHQVGAPSRAKVFPKYRGDLIQATVVVDGMYRRMVEVTKIPRNPLDVLAQQLVATVADATWEVDDLYTMVRGAAPYADLGRAPFEAVLDMLAGRYPSDLFAELRPRVVWDRTANTVTGRAGARMLAVTNPGTIPDRGLYGVHLPDGGRVGELDEEMVYESRPGDAFILGASTWKIVEITHDRVEVVPAPGEPGATMPFWHGDMMGRPLETGRALGAFVREISSLEAAEATTRLQQNYRLNEMAAKNVVAYLAEEQAATGTLPTDQTIVVQRFRDEIGDWRLVLLSPFGARVHAPWAMALTQMLRTRFDMDVDVIWADDGIAFRFPDADRAPDAGDLALDPDDVEDLVVEYLGGSALFSARFREASARALLLPRRRPGGRTPLWLQRRRAADLLAVAKDFGSFPILLETYREVLQDDFDLPGLLEVLQDVRSRRIRLAEVETVSASPFAASLLFEFIAAYLYEGDTPLAERRAAALTLDRELLRELLGEGELRELLSADVVQSVELELQSLAPDRLVAGPDRIHDLLRRIGPLSTEGITARCKDKDAAGGVLDELEKDRRILAVRVAGQDQWAAVEDAARLRDALGTALPPGVPDVFLEPVPDPLGDVIGRFARTHGPFVTADVVAAFGLPSSVVAQQLSILEGAGRVTRGAFRPGGRDQEWVDTEVLRRLKRRSLAVLRREIEPVDQSALGRFLPAWHGLHSIISPRRPAALVDTIRRLQGASLPASVLERDLLEDRLNYRSGMLDQLMVAGEVVWVGRGALGPRDGRLSLYFRDQLPRLYLAPNAAPPDGDLHKRLRDHLANRGASFFAELYAAAEGGDPGDVLDSLWDLVWAGEVTNDSLAPLRAFLAGKRSRRPRRPAVPSQFPPSSAGRWYLVADLLDPPVDPTVAATAWAEQLLERHGVVTRDMVAAESIPGGFSGLYPVLTRMEETGRIRRGYFVEGLGGAQFALPGAVDRLRQAEQPGGVMVLAATDPANPYGTALAWPPQAEGRASRSAGAYVLLEEGKLVAFVERGAKRLLSFTEDPEELDRLAARLGEVGRRTKRMTLETINGLPARDTTLGRLLGQHGFTDSYRGLAYKK
jgi:ATP-dependent Lhr-like helicase